MDNTQSKKNIKRILEKYGPPKRNLDHDLFYSKLKKHGLTLTTLGLKLDPPVTKFRVHQFIKGAKPEYRLKEIAAILKTNVKTIFPVIEESKDESRTDQS